MIHQLVSRVYAIFLREVLGYKQVNLVPVLGQLSDEHRKIFFTLENLADEAWPTATLDLEVFMLSDYHIVPPEIAEAGPLTRPGRFSFFIPKNLLEKSKLNSMSYPYTILQRGKSEHQDLFQRFLVDADVHQILLKYTDKKCNATYCDEDGMYRPKQCANTNKCAALLTSSYLDMKFVAEHIQELDLSINVYWLDKNLKHVIKSLLELYSTNSTYLKKSSNFLVLHWSPSEIIDGSLEFIRMQMPLCEDFATTSREKTGCKYEMIPILKYYTSELKNIPAIMVQQSLLKYGYTASRLKSLISNYESYEDELNWPKLSLSDKTEVDLKVDSIYNKIACEWLRNNPDAEEIWMPRGEEKQTIYIGGIFPVTVPGSNAIGNCN